MAERQKRRPAHPRRALDDREMAIALAHAATFGASSAARQFGLHRRTIQRYQQAVNKGENPKLSQLIAEELERNAQRSRDKLHRAFDALLSRIIELAPTAKLSDITPALEKVGELVIARKMFGDDENPGEAQAPAGDEDAGGRDPGAEGQADGEGGPG